MRFLLAMALIVCMTMLARGADDKPEFAGKMTNAADKFEAETTKEGTVWKITSTKGIGGGFVQATKGKLPEKFTVRFPKLRNMESLTITIGTVPLKGALEKRKSKSVLYFDKKGVTLKEAKGSAYTLTIEKTKDGIDVGIEAGKGLVTGKLVRLLWVDNFR